MLKCDFCHAYWHLDCCDPPLANPPHISLEASQRDAWKCPRHIDHDLRSGLLVQHDLSANDHDDGMSNTEPVVRIARRVRVRKQSQYIEPTFSRGMRNNGLIEITNDPDDDTDGEGNYVFGDNDPKDLSSKIFRVPEKGVILDFVSKVKRYVLSHLHDAIGTNASSSGRVMKNYEARKVAEAAAQRNTSMQNYLAHSIEQQQAALALAQLAGKEPEVTLSEGKVHALIYSLTVRLLPAPHMPCFVIVGANSRETVRSSSERHRCHGQRRPATALAPRACAARDAPAAYSASAWSLSTASTTLPQTPIPPGCGDAATQPGREAPPCTPSRNLIPYSHLRYSCQGSVSSASWLWRGVALLNLICLVWKLESDTLFVNGRAARSSLTRQRFLSLLKRKKLFALHMFLILGRLFL
jgi:hypothetical protein